MDITFTTFLLGDGLEGWEPDSAATNGLAASEGAYGFCIFENGNIIRVQDCDPDEQGWVPMTLERATALAQETVDRFTAVQE